MTDVTRQLVPQCQRMAVADKLFDIHFPLRLEPTVFSITAGLAEAYQGGFWHFYVLSNGGFYMAPDIESPCRVVCDNGFAGVLSADALGITACLYAYSRLSFLEWSRFVEVCAQQYHLLREYMMEHPEAGNILRAID